MEICETRNEYVRIQKIAFAGQQYTYGRSAIMKGKGEFFCAPNDKRKKNMLL